MSFPPGATLFEAIISCMQVQCTRLRELTLVQELPCKSLDTQLRLLICRMRAEIQKELILFLVLIFLLISTQLHLATC